MINPRISLLAFPLVGCLLPLKGATNPNLIIIHTDEQSFRSLSCYQRLLGDMANPWNASELVQTPNIDRIAQEGALCTNYYAACPTSTPSRASMLTGLYPTATGADKNEKRMKDGLTTYAQVLSENGYQTTYVGKWHLDGVGEGLNFKYFQDVTDENCGFEVNRGFGFQDYDYRFETGHYPWVILDKSKNLKGRTGKKGMSWSWGPAKPDGDVEFMTDFFTDIALEKLDTLKGKPFCLMLAIPDPHTPNVAREPYFTQFMDVAFQEPQSMASINDIKRPGWGSLSDKNEVGATNSNANYQGFNVETSGHGSGYMNEYWGMVKCIDDNVGRIFKFLDDNNLTDNTIVIFTSDHGDMLFEHNRINKGVPYEGSNKVAFVIRYPKKIKAGKIINTPESNVDFLPTILDLMDVPGVPENSIHGKSRKNDFIGDEAVVNTDNMIFSTQDGGYWVAAANSRYKLVLSSMEQPWLCDAVTDPYEMKNNIEGNEDIALILEAKIKETLTKTKDAGLFRPLIYITEPPEVPEIEEEEDNVTSQPLDTKFFGMEGPSVFNGTTKKWTFGTEWSLINTKYYEGGKSMMFTHGVALTANSAVHAPKGTVILAKGGHKASIMVWKKSGSELKKINIVIKYPSASNIPAFDVSNIECDKWVEVSQTFTMLHGSSDDGAVSFMVEPADAGNKNTVWLDNFKIIDAEDPNYNGSGEVEGPCTSEEGALLNTCLYGFETKIIPGGSTWNTDEWYAANNVFSYFKLSNEKQTEGSQSLLFTHSQPLEIDAQLYPKFGTMNLSADQYTINLNVFKTSGSVLQKFHLVDEDGIDVSADIANIETDKWVSLSLPYNKTKDSSDKDRLRFIFKKDEIPTGSSAVYIDDVRIDKGSSISAPIVPHSIIYQNSASAILYIDNPMVKHIALYSIDGKLLRTYDKDVNPYAINVNDFTEGLYLISLIGDKYSERQKIQIKYNHVGN